MNGQWQREIFKDRAMNLDPCLYIITTVSYDGVRPMSFIVYGTAPLKFLSF